MPEEKSWNKSKVLQHSNTYYPDFLLLLSKDILPEIKKYSNRAIGKKLIKEIEGFDTLFVKKNFQLII